MILNLTRKQIFANGAKNRTHKLRLIWNSLSWSKEIPRQKCIVMAISCRDRYLYIFAYIMYMIWYIYIILVVIFWDLSNVCFLSPHSSSLQMLSGVRLTPNFLNATEKRGTIQYYIKISSLWNNLTNLTQSQLNMMECPNGFKMATFQFLYNTSFHWPLAIQSQFNWTKIWLAEGILGGMSEFLASEERPPSIPLSRENPQRLRVWCKTCLLFKYF